MTSLEQAAADLREAEAKLNAHTPKEVLENAVTIAKEAVLAAARTPKPTTFTQEEVAEAARVAVDSFRGSEDETAVCAEPSTGADELFEETAVDVNVQPVESAAMQDVIESVTAAAETIDATDEVSIEEAVEAADPEIDPNAHLGENYRPNGSVQAE